MKKLGFGFMRLPLQNPDDPASEGSQKFGMPQDTLRYYERIGLIPRVNRNKSGGRDYMDQDCKWVEFIRCMRVSGLPI